jgi:DUF4097 and DUF4098 domain-containing protein YvlB
MKLTRPIYVVAALVCLGSLANAQTPRRVRSRNFNINSSGDATSCADFHVSSSAELAQLNQTFSLSKGEAPILEMNVGSRGQVHVRSWDHADYSIETCKIASADTRPEADALVRAITVNHAAGNVTFNGPTTDTGEWMVVFFVKAPKDASLNLEALNQPMDVKGINGTIKMRATNGPIAVSDCGGNVDVQTVNGPIAFNGDRGDVHLVANNGPIAVNFPTETWNGSVLEARTINGPLAVHMPDNFRSGMRLETNGNSPISCQASACRGAWTDVGGGKRAMQMNGANEMIRLSTNNGPVALASGNEGGKGVR